MELINIFFWTLLFLSALLFAIIFMNHKEAEAFYEDTMRRQYDEIRSIDKLHEHSGRFVDRQEADVICREPVRRVAVRRLQHEVAADRNSVIMQCGNRRHEIRKVSITNADSNHSESSRKYQNAC